MVKITDIRRASFLYVLYRHAEESASNTHPPPAHIHSLIEGLYCNLCFVRSNNVIHVQDTHTVLGSIQGLYFGSRPLKPTWYHIISLYLAPDIKLKRQSDMNVSYIQHATQSLFDMTGSNSDLRHFLNLIWDIGIMK